MKVPNAGSVEESFTTFIESDVPTFGLTGHKKLIDPLMDYDIDADAQLVYKYMRAYKTGRINTLCLEGIIMHSRKVIISTKEYNHDTTLIRCIAHFYSESHPTKYSCIRVRECNCTLYKNGPDLPIN